MALVLAPLTAASLLPWSGAAVFAGGHLAARPAAAGEYQKQEVFMGRGILLWLLGVPIPIIILIALLYH